MNIFYTSDLHFNHKNIIKLCNRPFLNVREMNETIIKKWNSKVTDNDIVYILGDIALCNKIDIGQVLNLIKRLKGHKRLIVGNHDKLLLGNQQIKNLFQEITNYKEIFDNDRKVILFHYPIEEWNGFFRDSYHLYGHIHNSKNSMKYISNRFNVGVDVNNFEPKTLTELISNNQK